MTKFHPPLPPQPACYAVLMSGALWKRFDTSDEAWDFIERCRCNMCRETMVCRPYEQCYSCDAEWDVWTQEEWDEYGSHRLPEDEIKDDPTTPLPEHKAGYICFWSHWGWALHLFVRRKHWYWQWHRSEHESWIGFGPFFLYTRYDQ